MITITDITTFKDRGFTKLSINYSTTKDNGDIIVDNNTRMMNVVDRELLTHIQAIETAAKNYVEEAENDN